MTHLLTSKLWNSLSFAQVGDGQNVGRTMSCVLCNIDTTFGRKPGSVLKTTRSGKIVRKGSIIDNAWSSLTRLAEVTAISNFSFKVHNLIVASSGGSKGLFVRPCRTTDKFHLGKTFKW